MKAIEQIRLELEEGLAEQPLIDVHTHMDAAHIPARGLQDVLLYHMVISDLVSAGCRSRARLSEDPGEKEIETRLEEAIPLLPNIHNTSIFWGVRIILRDLYRWTEPVNEHNWRELHARIQEGAADPNWGREILRRAKIQRAGTELWRGRDHNAGDVFQYALEWAFFTRAQWGTFDTPLYELERTWSQAEPAPPLPVTLGDARPAVEKPIRSVDDVYQAVRHYLDCIPYGKLLSTAQHISTDIHYRRVSDSEMASALSRREQATSDDLDTYASFILEAFLTGLQERAGQIVYQFSFGAEPLPYETGSKLRQETIFELAEWIERFPKVHFQVFLSSQHTNQALCTLARELPNLSLCGYWWHNFFPSAIRNVLSERLDMLALNKQIGFFSDAYCADWAYAKAYIVRKQMAEVLAQKVAQGQYSQDEALEVAYQICFVSPQTLLRFVPNPNL